MPTEEEWKKDQVVDECVDVIDVVVDGRSGKKKREIVQFGWESDDGYLI